MAGHTTRLYIYWTVQQKLQISTPINIGIVEKVNERKAKFVMTLEDSADEKVRTAGVEIKTGREWSAAKAVTEAESRLKHKDIIGTAAVGRQGFSTSKNLLLGECKHSEETKFGPREIKMREEENRQAKTVDLGIRGAWFRWETEQ